MNILVIEDQTTHLKLAHHVLSAEGHDVIGAIDAEQAVALINADRPQLILVDLGLPGMSGLDLVRELKSNPAARDICIVAITGNPEEYPEAAALAAGCDAYFQKPLATRTLSKQLIVIAQDHGDARQFAGDRRTQ